MIISFLRNLLRFLVMGVAFFGVMLTRKTGDFIFGGIGILCLIYLELINIRWLMEDDLEMKEDA